MAKKKQPEKNLSNSDLARLVWRIDSFLASSGVTQEDANYIINEALPLAESWVENPEDWMNGFVLADWLTDHDKPELSYQIREIAAARGSMGTGTS